jgi:hypothetical protein
MKKLLNWIKGLFSQSQRLKDKYIPVAVKVVQGVKKAINNGTLDTISDILIAILPDAGDLVVKKVREYLIKHIPELCLQLEIIHAVNLSDKTEEAVKQSLAALRETYGDKWDEFTSGLAGDLANFFSDGKIDPNEAKILAKKFYDTYIKNAA